MKKNIIDIQDKIDKVREQQSAKEINIEETYKNAKKELKEENNKLSRLLQNEVELIVEYSKFKNIYVFMTVLAEIATLYTGEKYIYEFKDKVPTLIPDNLKKYDTMEFYDEYNPNSECLQFYNYDEGEITDLFQYNLKESVNLEKYEFLKKFIDYIICYKLETNRSALTNDTIKKLEQKFILANINEIKKINEEANEKEKLEREIRIDYYLNGKVQLKEEISTGKTLKKIIETIDRDLKK